MPARWLKTGSMGTIDGGQAMFQGPIDGGQAMFQGLDRGQAMFLRGSIRFR